jgi:FAD binding domain
MRALEPRVLGDLRTTFRGWVMSPGDEAYDAAQRVWNAMIDRRPAAVAQCSGTADAIRAVTFACEHDLSVSVRGGGHNVAGTATCEDGLMMDLSPMRGIHFDQRARRVRVQGGATCGVDHETQAFGLATPGGVVGEFLPSEPEHPARYVRRRTSSLTERPLARFAHSTKSARQEQDHSLMLAPSPTSRRGDA